MNVGPTPNRREMRAVTNEPISVPSEAAPSTIPSCRGPHLQLPRRVEQEEREEHEVEEVERRDAEELGADDRVLLDPPCSRKQAAALMGCARRLLRVDPSEEERRPEERASVEGQRVRTAEHLHQDAAILLPATKEKRAAVEERVGLHIVVARHDQFTRRLRR